MRSKILLTLFAVIVLVVGYFHFKGPKNVWQYVYACPNSKYPVCFIDEANITREKNGYRINLFYPTQDSDMQTEIELLGCIEDDYAGKNVLYLCKTNGETWRISTYSLDHRYNLGVAGLN